MIVYKPGNAPPVEYFAMDYYCINQLIITWIVNEIPCYSDVNGVLVKAVKHFE